MAQASITRAAAATASAVYGNSPPYIDVDNTDTPVLVLRDQSSNSVDVGFLSSLTLRAGAAASSLACGSILAGQNSESDEYGDVAFWLGRGDFGTGHEPDIIDALGLKTPESKVRHVDLSPHTHLPGSLLPLHAKPTREVASLTEALDQLQGRHCLMIEGIAADNSTVLYILLGQLAAPEGSSPGPWNVSLR
ncbi:uncharacterized protein B0H18DRAFT_1119946 [Fomitopsis serialis]|uniref:uncharacterized protein n=1 Tax=Fomitopsis serialis TaxID=139415 RepID=UPI00200877AF|nr:uncharacterized protein B0H18DRAFT_1119946 [Neoantrodia serialis]KAH9924411.1 hypothetical protein B0H18DRAFT_1119946 [Neoantrodia serialis]